MADEKPKSTSALMDMLGEDNPAPEDTNVEATEEQAPDVPADTEPAEGAEPLMEMPKNASTVGKMKVEELDVLYSQNEGLFEDIKGWSEMTLTEKRKAIKAALFEVKQEISTAPIDSPLTKVAQEIESLTDQTEIEAEIKKIDDEAGMADYRKGGLLSRLAEVGDFGEHETFRDYIFANYGLKYRKAMYLMQIYTALTEANIPYEAVQGIGWTKLKDLTQILTADNVDEWVAKAKIMNVPSLQESIKQYLAEDGEDDTSSKPKPAATMKSKTFKFAEEQLETVDMALDKAKKASGTDNDSSALQYALLDYLGTPTAPKTDAALQGQLDDAKDLIATQEAKIAELTSAAEAGLETPAQFFARMLSEKGNQQNALVYMFDDAQMFAELFDKFDLEISPK